MVDMSPHSPIAMWGSRRFIHHQAQSIQMRLRGPKFSADTCMVHASKRITIRGAWWSRNESQRLAFLLVAWSTFQFLNKSSRYSATRSVDIQRLGEPAVQRGHSDTCFQALIEAGDPGGWIRFELMPHRFRYLWALLSLGALCGSPHSARLLRSAGVPIAQRFLALAVAWVLQQRERAPLGSPF